MPPDPPSFQRFSLASIPMPETVWCGTQGVEFSVRVSFLEMYNEELFDLLGSTDDPLRLRIYEDSTKKVGTLQ